MDRSHDLRFTFPGQPGWSPGYLRRFTVVYDGVIGPWFLETFRAATRAAFLHYAILLPPERVCLDRVRSRTGHGFTDQQAALHMYQQLASADIAPRYVIAGTDEASALAYRLFHLVQQGRLRWPARH
jgi:hypothetical protein